ncbi:MAG: hydrogenase expression protein [SAR202 cluster bacterium]|nr:hydrogenase expression protein [SAR202 cluster bacterium]
MELGKFPPELLQKLLAKSVSQDPQVLVGPGIGQDAAVIRQVGGLLVAKSDPITFATDRIGWYAVQVNANDVACTGATPRWFLATLLVPQSFTPAQAEAVFDQVLEACHALGVTLIGGHSEVTYGLDRPIVMGSMLGEVAPDRLVRSSGAQEGDSIVLTKGIAIEGTALLARERGAALAQAGVAPETIEQATALLHNPGISVVKEAGVACSAITVHAMHDPTEGGLATALRELAQASGLGLVVDAESIPVLSQTEAICRALQLDPLGLLASGALLITLAAGEVPALLGQLDRQGIPAFEIGQMVASEDGLVLLKRDGSETPLPVFQRDELARYFAEKA